MSVKILGFSFQKQVHISPSPVAIGGLASEEVGYGLSLSLFLIIRSKLRRHMRAALPSFGNTLQP